MMKISQSVDFVYFFLNSGRHHHELFFFKFIMLTANTVKRVSMWYNTKFRSDRSKR